MMRLKTALLSLLTLGLVVSGFFVAAPVKAVDPLEPVCSVAGANKPEICNDNQSGSSGSNPLVGKDGIITKATSIIAMIVGIVSVIVIVVAGIRMMLSQGDPSKISTNRQTIIYACVGLVVAIVARGLVQFVLNKIP